MVTKAAHRTLMKLTLMLISPTFYEQFLWAQITKAQKDTDALIFFLLFRDRYE